MERTHTAPVVWVTGGAGYIGSNVVRELIAQGRKVVVIDDFSTGSKRFVPKNAHLVEMSLEHTDVDAYYYLEEVAREHGVPQNVIHLAAKSDVKWCEQHPDEACYQNVIATFRMASIAADVGCTNFTFISSAAVYGNTGRKKSYVSLKDPWAGLEPIGVYGQTKLDAEKMLNSYFKNHMRICVLRLFNVAGAGFGDTFNVSPRGKPDPQSQAIFPTLVRKYLAGDKITLKEHVGLFFNRSPVRDFIHVRDAALRIATCTLPHFPYYYNQDITVLNLGRGKPVPIADLLQLTEYPKKQIENHVTFVPAGLEEIPYSVAGSLNVGSYCKRTLGDMWHDEVRWQKSKIYQLIKSDKTKEKT